VVVRCRALDEGSNAERTSQLLTAHGFTHLTLQIGKGQYRPTGLQQLNPTPSTATATAPAPASAIDSKSLTAASSKANAKAKAKASSLVVDCFDYRPSLQAMVAESDLIISHAGAGSILEGLRARKVSRIHLSLRKVCL
jgi:UDP-N-acetylglucosamine transferase subunit ALG13